MRAMTMLVLWLVALPAGTVAHDLATGRPTVPRGSLLAAASREAVRLGQIPGTADADAWSVVRDLPAGTRVSLTLTDGAEVTGVVVEVRPDAMVMKETRTQAKTLKATLLTSEMLLFRRADITKAEVKRPVPAARSGSWLAQHPVLGGLAIGMAGGAVVGAASCANAPEFAGLCGLAGAGIGSGGGALIGLAMSFRK